MTGSISIAAFVPTKHRPIMFMRSTAMGLYEGVDLDFSQPGKPMDNPSIEALTGRFRQQRRNENWLLSLEDTENKVESWPRHCNGEEAPQCFGPLVPQGICRNGASRGSTRKTRTVLGTKNGTRPLS